jgi:hypothetical protein
MSISTPPTSVAAASHDDAARLEPVAEVAGRPFTATETAGAISLGVIALLIAGLMPLLLPALHDEGRLSAAGIGLTAMLEALSMGLVAGAAGIVLKPRRLRLTAAAASALLVAVDLATLSASGPGVMLVRALAGVPEGIMLWVAIGLISRTATPERWAAVLFTGMGLTQLGAASALSGLVLPRFGANGGYEFVACAVALGVFAALLVPRALGAVPGLAADASGAPPPRGWIALFGTLSMAASLTAVAVYVVPLAHQAGLSAAVGRSCISVGLACQILGGVLATVLAGRVRYIVVFWGCGLAFLATWAVYAVHAPGWLFIAMSGVAGLGAMLAGPFLLPMTIEADPSRRATMQSGTVQILAGALGPLLSSFVVSNRDVHGVLILGAVLQLTGLAVATTLNRIARLERMRRGAA